MRSRSKWQNGQLLTASASQVTAAQLETLQQVKEDRDAGLHHLIARHFRSPELRRLAERVIIDNAQFDGARYGASSGGGGGGTPRATAFRNANRSHRQPLRRQRSFGETAPVRSRSFRSMRSARPRSPSPSKPAAATNGASAGRRLSKTSGDITSERSSRGVPGLGRSYKQTGDPQARASGKSTASTRSRHRRTSSTVSTKTASHARQADALGGSAKAKSGKSFLSATASSRQRARAHAHPQRRASEVAPSSKARAEMRATRTRGSRARRAQEHDGGAHGAPLAVGQLPATVEAAVEEDAAQDVWDDLEIDPAALHGVEVPQRAETDSDTEERDALTTAPAAPLAAAAPSKSEQSALAPARVRVPGAEVGARERARTGEAGIAQKRAVRPESDSWADLSLPSVEGENDEPVLESGAHGGPMLLPFRDSSFKQHTVGQMTFNPLLQRWENSCDDEENHIMEAFDAASWSSDGDDSDSSDEDDEDDDHHHNEAEQQQQQQQQHRTGEVSLEKSKSAPSSGAVSSASPTAGTTSTMKRRGSTDPNPLYFELSEADLASFRRSEKLSAASSGIASAPDLGPLAHQDLVQLAMERILVANQAKNHQNFSFSASGPPAP